MNTTLVSLTWWLIVVFTTPLVDGTYAATKLHEYSTFEECAPEAIRIAKEMKLAYPSDKTYVVQCWNSTEKHI